VLIRDIVKCALHSFKPSMNKKSNSGPVGDSCIAPKALAYFTKKGSEREVVLVEELAHARNKGRGLWVGFSTQPNVQLLFDVPKEIANKPTKLLLEILVGLKYPPLKVEVVK
jgi:hypothetical protein